MKKRNLLIVMLLMFSWLMLMPSPKFLRAEASSYRTATYAAASDYLDIGTCGENLTYTLSSDGTLSITGGGDMDSFSGPGAVPWFKYRSLIKTVTFGGNITSIGAYAFDYCVQLKSITVPGSLTSIGDYSFYGCSGLAGITLPGNVKEIGNYAFYECSGLTRITLSAGLTDIGTYAFYGCSSLKNIAIPESVTNIGEGAFEQSGVDDSEIAYKRGDCGTNLTWALLGGSKLCIYGTGFMTDYSSGSAPWYSNREDITEAVISDGVTGVGDYAFDDCLSLKSVTLADSVKKIGKYAFSKCTALTEADIHTGITEISDYAFYQSGIKKVIISGNDTVSIGDYAFAGCTAMESVLLEKCTLETGNYMFNGCTKLKEAAVSAAFNSMGSHMFAGCTSLSEVSLVNTDIAAYMFSGCTSLKEIEVPKGITELGSYAFQNCTGISRIILPDTVTKVNEGVFSGCSGLGEIQFSKNIEIIGDNAFEKCTGFTSVVIPNSVTKIGSGAFSGCNNLESITLPFLGGSKEEESVSEKTLFGYVFGTTQYDGGTETKQYYSASGFSTYYLPKSLIKVIITGGKITYGAFDNCAGLESITLPDDVTNIDGYVFRGCEGLKSITISQKATSIGEYAFSGCIGLDSVELPEGLLKIGSGAFKDCTGLKKIELPRNITGIESYTFSGCTQLQNINISEKINSIGDYAFSGCVGLEGMKLSEIMTELGKGVFKDCTGIQSIVLPKGITNIDDHTFYGCTALKSITILGDVDEIGSYAFGNCTSLGKVSIPETVTGIGNYAFSGCTKLESILLPENLETIGSFAFQNCNSITAITVPNSVITIDAAAFSGCSSLESITLPFVGDSEEQNNASVKSLFGYIFGTSSYQGGTAIKQNYSGSGTTYYIPDSLKKVKITGGEILYGAFYNCSGLTEIILPAGLTEIGDYAFYNCTGLTGITLPAGVTGIGSYVFKDCIGLEKITIPQGVTEIESYTFSGCSGLKSITIPGNVKTIGTYAFQDCGGMTDITVPDTVTAINAAAFSGCSSLESITLPFVGESVGQTSASAKSLFGYIFGTSAYTGGTATKQYYSSSSVSYYIPDSLKKVVITGGTILYGAFYNCSNLTSITLPENLLEISNYAFYGCSNLIGITLSKNLMTIGNYAFYNCSELAEVVFPSTVTSIGTYAFKDCRGLKAVSLPQKVTGIEKYTFSGCTGLKNIIIPNNVATIGSYAFQNCSSITSVIIPDSVKTIDVAAFAGCGSMESMTLPFVGGSNTQTTASAKTLFGYIFGTGSYTNSVAVKQYYSNSYSTYYIPASLKTVVITSGNILYGAFYNCNSLTSITLPEDLTSIGKSAFYNCTGLTGIIIPPEVTTISTSAFANCTGLEYITFSGNAPTTIDSNAFRGVAAVVLYPKSDTTWADYIGNNYGGTLSWEEHTHSYQAVVTEPTCKEQGYTTYQCSSCNRRYISDYVNKLEHKLVTDKAVQATCTRTGLTEGTHCSVCEEVIVPQNVVQALGHRYMVYVPNHDATYEADGTKTAKCDNGCGEEDTITDTGSMLTDSKKPTIEISLGNNKWTDFMSQITFGLFFKNMQTVTITAADNEKPPNGSEVSRLDKVYYYITDTTLEAAQLESISWTEYTNEISLNPGKKYIVYAKAVDKSNNIAYASSQGIIVDSEAPVIEGILGGAVYCKEADFYVTDISLKSVTDNGIAITPSDGKYTIKGDGEKHTIIAADDCGNTVSVTIVINRDHKWGTYSYNDDASCTVAGTKTAVCEYKCGARDIQIDETHPATGHSYGEPTFLWSNDNRSCTASYICGRDSSHVETVKCTVKEESLDASCTTEGEITYTATAILDGITRTDSKTISGVVLGHDYATEFVWSADKSSCKVTLTCQRESCSEDTIGHTKSGLECTVEMKMTVATCISEGKKEMIASITVGGVEYTETNVIEVFPLDEANHVNVTIIGAKEPTETENGYTGDTYCNDCKKTLAYGSEILSPGGATTEAPGGATTEVPGGATTEVSGGATTEVPGGTTTETPSGATTETPGGTTGASGGMPTEAPGGTTTGILNDQNTFQNQLTNEAVPEKGKKLKDSNGAVYTITKAGSVDGTVSYTAPPNKNIKSVKIPATVELDGITYKVTAISDSALANCKKLTKVTIGSNITAISKYAFKNCFRLKKVTIPKKVTIIASNAFYGCKKLANITIKSQTLKTVSKNAFKGIKTTAKVKVPPKKLADYRKLLKTAGLSNKAKITK